jgi:hypothetical protein
MRLNVLQPAKAWRVFSSLNDRFPAGQATDELLLIIMCSEQPEWRDRVGHLPL